MSHFPQIRLLRTSERPTGRIAGFLARAAFFCSLCGLSLFAALPVLAAEAGTEPPQSAPTTPQVQSAPLKPEVQEVAPGLWRVRFGEPEAFVPTRFRFRPVRTEALAALKTAPLPFRLDEIACHLQTGRCVVSVPLEQTGSDIYGFGLDPNAFRQKGLVKTLQVSAEPVGKTGYSHGPTPFYVSTAGYGVWVDTARVPVVHVGTLNPKRPSDSPQKKEDEEKKTGSNEPKTSVSDLYAAQAGPSSSVVFDIPAARGVDVYVFAGPTIREAVQRYNLFSGGGAMPPMWGLGMKYRVHTGSTAQEALALAKKLREQKVPCDMLGLEPGWQSQSYSCSLTWSKDRFPDPQGFLDTVRGLGYKVNLWEHAYIHPTSPLYKPLESLSGDYLVWGGLVPDFTLPEARRIYGEFFENTLVKNGISGFKSDECDKQPLSDTSPFNFPFASTFPSGVDGDQYAQLFGTLQQQALADVFDRANRRTWSDVRAAGSLAAPYPFTLYSDAYDQAQYLRQLLNASFAGELWSPEVRDAGSAEELVSRVALSAFAPQMCLNMWYLKNPPWMQPNRDKNNAGAFLDNWEAVMARCRDIVELRMRLAPYFYAAFYQYHQTGVPVFRALPIDFADDPEARGVEDEFMAGDHLLVAPIVGGGAQRFVYLPKGTRWVSYQTRELFEGGARVPMVVSEGEIPLFVRENAILPLAEPVQSIEENTVFEITAHIYGEYPAPFTLIEDDGVSRDFERGALNTVTLSWDRATQKGQVERKGSYRGVRYRMKGWAPVAIQPAGAAEKAPSVTGTLVEDEKVQPQTKPLTDARWDPSSVFESARNEAAGHLLDETPVTPFAFHTNNGEREYVFITLKAPAALEFIRIQNRLNSTSESNVRDRAKSLAVWASLDGRAWERVWTAQDPRDEWLIHFDKPLQAQYLKVGLQEKNFLHLRKVLLYPAKEAGK